MPGDVYNLRTVPVLLQCLRNHISPQGVDSRAGLKQDRSEMCLCLVGCEVAVCAQELVAGAVKQNMLLFVMFFYTRKQRETPL